MAYANRPRTLTNDARCCLIGFTNGVSSFRASGYVHLTSSDGSVTIDTSNAGVIDLISNGGGGSGGSVTGLTHAFDSNTNVLTTTLTQSSGLSPITATTTIPIGAGGSGCCNSGLSIDYDPLTGVLTSSITDDNGTISDTTTFVIPEQCCNDSVSVSYDEVTGILTVGVTDTNGTVSDTATIPVGNTNQNTSITQTFTPATRNLQTTVNQTTGGPVSSTVNIPTNVVTDTELFWEPTNNTLQITINQTLASSVSDTVSIPIPDAVVNTAIEMECDEVTGILTTTVSDTNGDVSTTINIFDMVLKAICNMPEVDINDASVTGPYYIFGVLDDGSCAKLVGEVCTATGGSEECNLTLTSSQVTDSTGSGTTNRQIDSTTVTLYFNEELGAGAVGNQDGVAQTNDSWLYFVDQVGDYVTGTWTYVGVSGSGYGYVFTPTGNLLPNYSYTAGASVDTAAASDPSCTVSNSGNAVSFSTEPIPNNQVLNSGMDANLASWNPVNATATYTAGGANGTAGYAEIVGTGGNLQFRQDTVDVTNATSYALGFWHRGQDTQVRLTQSSTPFATLGLDYSTGVDANWTYHYVEFTANATEVNARLQFIRLGAPAAGYAFDIDEVYLGGTP